MSGARLERMESLFHAALALPSSERGAFLRAEETDSELRAAVERLLAHHTENDASLRDALNAAVVADSSTRPARERIGTYRLLSELGAGGMGTVFLAERQLGETRQRVALKLIRGFPTSDARARLARERALLAELNHPNIARLLDGGDSEDGQPYLVMEYVDGEPLLDYCTEHALGIAPRLALFAQLCRAVQHAHQHLIVHRDIKPGNVLVREDGTPVLLDFGIGKLLDGTQPDATATRIFTPAYAAPEQRTGHGVTTATDVYALGCVLFELLTACSLGDVATSGEPLPLPSSVVVDRTLARTLRGDLDNVVLKATHEEAQRRYGSAQALAEDIENYLHGRPLEAGPDRMAYRARKFIMRYPYALAATVLMIVLSGLFVWRLAVERARALEQAQRAEATRDFLVSLFRFADPGINRGKPPAVHELLDQGRAEIDKELAAQPKLRGELNLALAEIYEHLAEHDSARVLAQNSLALAGDDPALRAERLALLATIDANDGHNAEALANAEQGLQALAASGGAHSLDQRLGLLNTKAMSLKFLNRADEAAATMREVLALLPQLGAKQEEHRAYTLDNLAHVEELQGHHAEALRYATAAEAAFVELRGAAHPEPLAVGAYRASMLAATNDLAGAEAKYREVLAAQRRLYSDDNDRRLTNTETYLARVLLREDRADEALALVQRAQARCERTAGADHAQCPATRQIWGEAKIVRGDNAAGMAALREAVALRDADTDGDARSRDLARVSLARGECLTGDSAQGRVLLESVRADLLAMPITSALERSFIERVGRECAASR